MNSFVLAVERIRSNLPISTDVRDFSSGKRSQFSRTNITLCFCMIFSLLVMLVPRSIATEHSVVPLLFQGPVTQINPAIYKIAIVEDYVLKISLAAEKIEAQNVVVTVPKGWLPDNSILSIFPVTTPEEITRGYVTLKITAASVNGTLIQETNGILATNLGRNDIGAFPSTSFDGST